MPNVRYSTRECSYYGSRAFASGNDGRCRVDLNYGNPYYRTHCMGCGEPMSFAAAGDPQVLLDQTRAALLNTQSKIADLRRFLGRPQTARATLRETNTALAAVQACIENVVAGTAA